MKLIEIKNLKTHFYMAEGVVKAVDGISFSVDSQKTVGLVGESGCGKSVTAQSILGLVDLPGRTVGGQILYRRKGELIDLLKLKRNGKKMREIRGNEIAMIFQEPMTSLNPAFSVGDQLCEAITLHQNINKKEAKQKAMEWLDKVGIGNPGQCLKEFPHRLSGGMCQRVMIAISLSCDPGLLIADEPTTALDVTIQAQVLRLMNKLKDTSKTSILFITHDLGIIAKMTDDVIVMYLGKIVESAPTKEIFQSPCHPYTIGLMKSIPSLATKGNKRLIPIEGVVPDQFNLSKGCGFEPRCSLAKDICRQEKPSLEMVAKNHKVACWAINKM